MTRSLVYLPPLPISKRGHCGWAQGNQSQLKFHFFAHFSLFCLSSKEVNLVQLRNQSFIGQSTFSFYARRNYYIACV